MNLEKSQFEKARSAKSVEELLALAAESGVKLSDTEAKQYFAKMHHEGAISDDELDHVSGGCGGRPDFSYTTYLKCANCGNTETWGGDFSDGKYECSVCHLNTLVAVSVTHD